ncbi:hypothetical protein ACQFN5_29200 (plasmid) [Klebsiella sp. WOUb02]|uniref:hypothetical protein n=1 Tax=Klebsiella sp. WOUb02 TaxID=3161071 RepID=UPI003CEB0CBF
MADYYSESAFIIETKPEQSAILSEAMYALFVPDDDFIQKLISCENTDGLSEVERIVRHCVANSDNKCNARSCGWRDG